MDSSCCVLFCMCSGGWKEILVATVTVRDVCRKGVPAHGVGGGSKQSVMSQSKPFCDNSESLWLFMEEQCSHSLLKMTNWDFVNPVNS